MSKDNEDEGINVWTVVEVVVAVEIFVNGYLAEGQLKNSGSKNNGLVRRDPDPTPRSSKLE